MAVKDEWLHPTLQMHQYDLSECMKRTFMEIVRCITKRVAARVPFFAEASSAAYATAKSNIANGQSSYWKTGN